MCDCLKKGTEKLKNHLTEQLRKDDSGFIEVVSAGYKNRCLCLSGNSSAPISLPFEIRYKRKLKNGKVREKKIETGILPSYCPFCGEKFDKETKHDYAVHINGPDDITGPYTEIEAHRKANSINKGWLKEASSDRDTPLCCATVVSGAELEHMDLPWDKAEREEA